MLRNGTKLISFRAKRAEIRPGYLLLIKEAPTTLEKLNLPGAGVELLIETMEERELARYEGMEVPEVVRPPGSRWVMLVVEQDIR